MDRLNTEQLLDPVDHRWLQLIKEPKRKRLLRVFKSHFSTVDRDRLQRDYGKAELCSAAILLCALRIVVGGATDLE